jgi:rubrerythrin
MLWGLLRYLDPKAWRQRQEDLRRQQEDWPPDIDPHDTDIKFTKKKPETKLYECRVCGRTDEDPRFCSDCLAETKKPA